MKVVGHRGFPEYFPENSLVGLEQAILAGADAIELDIQFSRDGEPYILHDASFDRTSNTVGAISDLTVEDIARISVHEPLRFGDVHDFCPVPHLSDLVTLLGRYPLVKVFIEVKEETLQNIGTTHAIFKLRSYLKDISERSFLISFDVAFVAALKQRSGFYFGWILRHYSAKERSIAEELDPDLLIVNWEITGSELLWQGDWQWFVYDTTDKHRAAWLCERGAHWIETWDVQKLTS